MKPYTTLNHFTRIGKLATAIAAIIALLCLPGISAIGQGNVTPVKTFTKRTVGNKTPPNGVYRIKGDFMMLGNINLTLETYSDEASNADAMKFVDVDNVASTFNSSMANLSLRMENGADPQCSNILFAGLYWMGRSHLDNNVFDVTRTTQVPTAVNATQAVKNGNTINHTTIPLAVTRQGNNNNRYPRFTFTVGGSTYAFSYNNGTPRTVTVSVNGGAATTVPTNTETTSGDIGTMPFTTPYVLQDVAGGIKVVINSLVRDNRTNREQDEYQANAVANVSITGTTMVNGTETRSFDKTKVSIKGPGAAAYTEYSADASNILFPTGSSASIFVGYKDVTEYVQQHGVGDYYVADLALLEGTSDGTGRHGGWSLVVIYENSKMKWRDVTMYDGFAYMPSDNAGNGTTPAPANTSEINITNFDAAPTGQVNMKVGIIASEGERGIKRDAMAIRNAADNAWVPLRYNPSSSTVNDYTNFFTSSIQTGGNTRNPNLVNNTGVDIMMFDLPNPSNSNMANGQTDTKFQLATGQDTYVWFNFTFSVDSYQPEVQNHITVPGGMPASVTPGQEVEFKVDIRNLGNEAVNGYEMVLPVPAFATVVPGSFTQSFNYTAPPTLPGPGALVFDPLRGPNGSIVYTYGTLPLSSAVGLTPSDILASFTFKLKAIENCILLRSDCEKRITESGTSSGIGAESARPFNNISFVSSLGTGDCATTPSTAPLTTIINAASFVAANCVASEQWTPGGQRIFSVCQEVYLQNGFSYVTFSAIAGNFPANTKFYAKADMTGPEFTSTNSFPAILGDVTYYAMPPGIGACITPFHITVCNIPQTLTGLVWIDKDGDKTKDAGEGFFPNNTYTVLGIVENGMDSKKVIGTALVNGSGVYSLTVSGNPVFNPDFTISNPSYTLQIALTTGAPATGSTVPALPTSSAMGTAAAPINTNYYVTNPLAPDNKLNGLGIASAAVVSAPYTPITNNIGIQSPPIAQPQSQVLPKQVKNVKFYQMLPTAPSTNILDGTDLEDGILGVGTTFNTFRIQSNPTIQSATPPANPLVVKLAYDWGGDGITDTDIIDAGVEGDGTYVDIPNFNPARLYVYYESGSGNYTGYFTYSSIDGAGAVSAPVQYSFDAILPITGVELAGTYNNVKANLQWTVLSIDDVDHFEVERGNNSAGFSKVANVNVMGLSYKLSDDLSNFSGNDVFYRVKVVSKNGSISYSNVIILKKATITGLQVLPTLVQSHVQVRFNNTRSQQVTVKVMSSGGQAVMIHNTTLGIGNASINLNGFERLPNGTYNVQVFADNSVQQAKIVVQH